MSPRVTSDLLQVGSIPAASTADALRAAAANFAGPGLVFTLPDFGVAMYCGFRVQPGSTPEQAIREHRDVVTAVRRP